MCGKRAWGLIARNRQALLRTQDGARESAAETAGPIAAETAEAASFSAPTYTSGPSGRSDSRDGAQRSLDWQAFSTRYFPGGRRHDLDAITAYAADGRERDQPLDVSAQHSAASG